MPRKRPHGPTFDTILPPSFARAAAPGNSQRRFARVRPRIVPSLLFESPKFHDRFPVFSNRLTLHSFMVLFQTRIFRALKSMSRDEQHGIRFNPQRIVGFISDGCGGVDWRTARADWPSRTCNASLRGASRQREAAAAARAAPCFRRRRRRPRVVLAASRRSVEAV